MNDKVKHILAGLLIAAFVGIPCYVNSYDLFAGLWGCLAGVIAGGVKEWCDNVYEWEWDGETSPSPASVYWSQC